MTHGWVKCEAKDMFASEYLVSLDTTDGKCHMIVDKQLVRHRLSFQELKVVMLPDLFIHKGHKRILLPMQPIEHRGRYAIVDLINVDV